MGECPIKRNQIALTLSLIVLLIAALVLPYPVRIARASTYQDKIESYSPDVYFTFEETSGSIAYDVSGNGRNGAYVGITLNAATSPFGTPAPVSDGINDYINGYSASLASVFSFTSGTLMTWVKLDSFELYDYFSYISGNSMFIGMRADPSPSKIQSITDASSVTMVSSPSTTWYCLVQRWDNATGYLQTYVDGSYVSQHSYSSSGRVFSQYHMAGTTAFGGLYSKGAISHTSYWASLLDETDIEDICDPNPTPTPTPTNTHTPTATSTATNTPTPVYGWRTPQVLTSGDWRYQAAVHMETTLGDIALVFLLLVIAGLIVRGLHVYSKRR